MDDQEELLNQVSNLIEELSKVQIYSSFESVQNLKSLSEILRNRKTRKVVTQHLSKLGFVELMMKILKALECKNGEYAKVEIWKPIALIYSILINASDKDTVICSSYMENGVIEFLKENCCWKHYLSEKNEKVTKIFLYSVSILYNVSRFFSIKKRCGYSVAWLIPMLSIKEDDLNIISMMLLSHMVDVNNNAVLRDDHGYISDIVKFLKAAVHSEDQSHGGFHLWELLLGIGKLAKNDFNREQLKQCGLLKLLMTLMQKSDDNIQAYAMGVMLTMLLDDNIIRFCLSSSLDKELKPILEPITDIDNFILSNNAKSALQQINDGRKRYLE